MQSIDYWLHLLLETFGFSIFGRSQMKLLNYLGNINFHILDNVGGIIYYRCIYQVIQQQLLLNLYLKNIVDLLKIHLIIHKNLKLFFLLLLKQQETFLNYFFLMNQQWVPPKCSMIIYRLLIWFLLGHSEFRELHNSISDQDQQYQLRYLTFFIKDIQTLISIKFLSDYDNLQDEVTPIYI
ncbi:unnamed protein product [Paramecium pentaurelia]|uniref:Uncharacterized protein n=1 Tax=Paramecium pentaurelia TaxID=43138 RepID=A0A8S1SAR7_9CILI|nr:unnamed protein product [Paramecium pentaurelia]